MLTIILIALGSLFVLGVVVHEIRSWRKPGHHISQNAPMNDAREGRARITQETTNVSHGRGGAT
jgi:hypothetical protein